MSPAVLREGSSGESSSRRNHLCYDVIVVVVLAFLLRVVLDPDEYPSAQYGHVVLVPALAQAFLPALAQARPCYQQEHDQI